MEKRIESAKRIFIIGVKGNGTSAIASILHAKGKLIEGSDVGEDFITKSLLDSINVLPHEFGVTTNFSEVDLVIYSTSVDENNPDLELARAANIPCITYPQALGELAGLYNTSIAVSGSHGKSTITSLLGYTLEQGGVDPTVLVGAEVVNWNSSVRVGNSDTFVFEADEYQNKFKYYFPNILIVNNIDFEHPDFFTTFEEYKKTFEDAIEKIPEDGIIIANLDHPVVEELVKVSRKKVIWYGEKEGADVRLTGRTIQNGMQKIEINGGKTFTLNLIGRHNAGNALAVIALARHLGVMDSKIDKGFSTFKSTKRRQEVIGEKNGVLVIDDFAHHPAEIIAAIDGFKEMYSGRRLVVVFQAHTFTRTQVLLEDFAKAFVGVDELVMIPIFGSAREKQGTITTEELVEKIKPHTPSVHIEESLESARKYLDENTKQGDLVVTMGAGHTWQLAQNFVKK